MQTKISILIPVYKSEMFIDKTVEKIRNTMTGENWEYEIILINDGSPDNSWKVIKILAENYAEVKSINLLKNYGQHSAILCGMQYASGNYLITMDDDLQNPPNQIPILVEKISEGFDLVFAKFYKKRHAKHRQIGTYVINYLNKNIFNKPDGIALTNFRIFTKEVSDRVLEFKTNHPYIPGLLLLNSNKIANVMTEHQAREEGKSNYSFIKILKLVSRLLINYSSYPLKVLTFIGLIVSASSFSLGFFYLIRALSREQTVPGWTSIIIMLAFLNGISILMSGVLGIYISRTLGQVTINRPYIVNDYAG